MTDFDEKKYVAVYDQFKVRQTTQLNQIWCAFNQMNMVDGVLYVWLIFKTPSSRPEHEDYDDEVMMVEDQIST